MCVVRATERSHNGEEAGPSGLASCETTCLAVHSGTVVVACCNNAYLFASPPWAYKRRTTPLSIFSLLLLHRAHLQHGYWLVSST